MSIENECPRCAELKAEIAKLTARIEELERRQKRQAAPFSKDTPKSDPKPPGRKSGDQYGTIAHREPPSAVDEEYVADLPERCPCCGGEIEYEKTLPQYQAEIRRQPLWRRFHVRIGRCKQCRRRVQGRHALQTSDALGAAAIQLGPDAQSLVVHANKELGLSHGKVTRLLQVGFGITFTRGASAQIMLRAAERCRGVYRRLLMVVRHSTYVVPDETGWRVEGIRHWLHVFVSLKATVYMVSTSRGADVARHILGVEYSGGMTHDGWSPYDSFEQVLHQQCLAHFFNRCKALLLIATRGAVQFPRAVQAIFQHALDLRAQRDAGLISRQGLAIATGRLEARTQRLLEAPRTHPANKRFAKHLTNHADSLFNFLRDPRLDATNWRAEQALRPAVVNRKVWGGNRTWRGAHAQSCLMSVMRTWTQHGHDSLNRLSALLRAPPPPSTIPPLASLVLTPEALSP